MMMPQQAFRHLVQRVVPRVGPVILLLTLVSILLTWFTQSILVARGARPFGLFLFVVLSGVYALPALLAFALAARIAMSFLKTLYKIRTLTEAGQFLYRLLFGSWAFGPFLVLQEGRITVGENSVLHRVGGPGYLVIYNDTAVVTERCGRLGRILSAHYPQRNNFPYLEPFEKVWGIVDLRPQHWTLPVKGMTRDGIPVICEADIRFQIDDRGLEEAPSRPSPPLYDTYPFTPEAVFRAATASFIRPPDSGPMDWRARVVTGFTDGMLRNILAEYYLDWLLGPTGEDTEHPREVIRRRLKEQLEQEAPKVGARILDVQLGEIKVEDEQIPAQWIEAWRAEWESQVAATHLEGEAELLRLETVRARAQAEMIISLIRELQDVAVSDEKLRPYLLAARLVETLRWMAYHPSTYALLSPGAIRNLHRLQEMLSREQTMPK
ncbi:MAG: SPFH domain-containing protein [Anaerolineae bacterium]|nr:SPFH domain-containing protein [Anaerolineae bacterium]MDW8069275.1 SPFH domain-containing protein [Anaerolineae bacterium]